MPTCSPGFLFFVQLDLVRNRLKRADMFSSGFLRSARSCAQSPEACRPVLVGLRCLRSARACARSPGVCRPVRRASFSSSSSMLCATAWSVPTCSPGLLFFVQLDLVRDCLKRADMFSSGFLLFVQLDLVHDRKACRPVLVGLAFLRPARSCARSLGGADLYSSGFLILVQLDLVRRSTEALRSSRLTLSSKLVSKCSSMITSLLLHRSRFPCAVCCTLTGLII